MQTILAYAALPQEAITAAGVPGSRCRYLETVRQVRHTVAQILFAAAAGRWRMKGCRWSRTSAYMKLRHDHRPKINVRVSNHRGRDFPPDAPWLVHLRIDRQGFPADMATLRAWLKGV